MFLSVRGINPDALQTQSSAKWVLGGLPEMSELELLQFLQTNYLRDLKKSPNQFSTHDCVSDELRLVIELKCRRTHYDDMTIEKKKFDALIAKAETLFYNAVYINSTPLGIYAWNLSLQEIEWHTHWMPASTDFGKSEQIEKVVGFLPISKAIKLTGALDY